MKKKCPHQPALVRAGIPKGGKPMTDQSIQQKQQIRTVFDVVRPLSELLYDIDIARGVPVEQAKKYRRLMQDFDMSTEKFLKMFEGSEC